MLLSVFNFKSIEKTVDIDISNLTVLAGVNSSGKSSLIQALLLLKQTLTSSSNEMLCLNGPYVYADSLMDLMHNKRSGDMGFELKLLTNDFGNAFPSLLDSVADSITELNLKVAFRVRSDYYVLSEFILRLNHKDGSKQEVSVIRRPKKPTYIIATDDDSNFLSNKHEIKDVELDTYSFANFFPIYAKKDNEVFDFALVKIVRDTLISWFDKISYIAPLRVAPVLARTYQSDVEKKYVLPDGENTRFILDEVSNDSSKIGLVKKWLCDEFHLAKDINIIKESGKRYRVVITTNENVKVDLMHMGFGLSQILPIITQGCISTPNSLMIVEDPDVHMHPSIQASMADFFIYLCTQRKVSVLVETHSDHFITRLRRRIAENAIDFSMVHLLFVMNESGGSDYKTIPLSDTGRMTGSMPPGFMNTRDIDFKAILEANRK